MESAENLYTIPANEYQAKPRLWISANMTRKITLFNPEVPQE
jgi:hypothetical protein